MHIGVDVGTSGTKTCAFDEQGNLAAEAVADYDFSETAGGRREIDSASFRAAALDTLASVAAQLKAAGAPMPRSITVASLGEAVMPLGWDGKPLHHFVTGTDRRGESESRRLEEKLGVSRIAAITGVPPGGLYSACKILWMSANRPELFGKARRWLTAQDFIIYTLCGEAVMDPSIASRTMLYDIGENRWSPPLLEAVGLREEQLPQVHPAGTAVGVLLPWAAQKTGLPADTLVVAGTHDHIANMLGCGVLRPGWACNATGTTEGISVVMEQRMAADDITACNIACEPFAIPGVYTTVAWHNAAGVLLKWFLREFGREDDGGFAGLDGHCAPGPTGLLALPHFSGGGTPDFDAASKGAIIGLTLGTTRHDLFKALMEGATFELRRILNVMRRRGLSAEQFVVCGGGANSGMWLQIKSDILNTELRIPTRRQNGALGCAMLGAVAAGAFENVYQAAEAMAGNRPATWPDAANAEIYAGLMKEYEKLYPALAPISHKL